MFSFLSLDNKCDAAVGIIFPPKTSAISTTGDEGAGEAKPAIPTAGSEEASEAKPAISIAGNGVGRKSQCESLAEVIKAKVEGGLSAQRIYQDLVGEHGFTDSYQSVKRFVRKLREAQPERVWRLECQPGEELQLRNGGAEGRLV